MNNVIRFPIERTRKPNDGQVEVVFLPDLEFEGITWVTTDDMVNDALDEYMVVIGRELTESEKEIFSKGFQYGYEGGY